jgi:superfamily II DNA or RNA helicase
MNKDYLSLRPDQITLINDLYGAIAGGCRNPLLVAPTGAGKTVMAARIMRGALDKSRRLLFCVHLDALVAQTFDKLQRFGLTEEDVGFIKHGWPERRDAPIQIASLQTLGRRKWWRELEISAFVLDEAHLTAFHTVTTKLEETFPDAVKIGLTATPWRCKKSESLADKFGKLIAGPTPSDLQKNGHLSPIRYFAIREPDLSEVGILGGEFKNDQLARACNRPEIIEFVVEEWQRLAGGARTLVFCIDIAHANAVAAQFEATGVPVATVTSETPIPRRNEIYQQFQSGSIKVISSVNCVSIGFDSPRAEVGLTLRPTKSPALWHQQIGRIMRTHPDKTEGVILDFSGNIGRHGIPELITSYCFQTKPKNRTLKCPECHFVILPGTKICPNCGADLTGDQGQGKREDIAPEVSELREITNSILSPPNEDKKQVFYREKLKSAYLKGYAPGWAVYRFKARWKEAPKPGWDLGAVFGGEPHYRRYANHLMAIAAKKNYPMPWVFSHFVAEFGADSIKHFPSDLLEVNQYA